MKVTLSIATYERTDYIERMSASLLASLDISRVNVRVYDDCSPSLSIENLHQLFPYAKEIIKREQNLRANANMKQIFEDFLQTEDDVLLLADSDLIYRSGWLEFIVEYLPQTDGILSIYDSRSHRFLENVTTHLPYGPKEHLGAAGTVFSRARVQDIVEAAMDGVAYDWAWSNLFLAKGYSLMCCKQSFIQHIGIMGENNFGALVMYDLSYTFVPNNEVTSQILTQFIEELVRQNDNYYTTLGIPKDFLEVRKYDQEFNLKNPTIYKYLRGGGSIMHYIRVRIRIALFRLLWSLR